MKTRNWLHGLLASAALVTAGMTMAADKPNILIIMGDDIGISNISKYSHGVMGYQTPSIDRIANEGVMFTDFYGEQSCTAGRSAMISGQHPVRTGLIAMSSYPPRMVLMSSSATSTTSMPKKCRKTRTGPRTRSSTS